jgi:hypothetical protein
MVKARHLTIMEKLRMDVLLSTEDYTYDDYTLVSEVYHFLERRISWQNGSQLGIEVAGAKLVELSSSKERKRNGIDQALLTIKQHGLWRTMEIGDPETVLQNFLNL